MGSKAIDRIDRGFFANLVTFVTRCIELREQVTQLSRIRLL